MHAFELRLARPDEFRLCSALLVGSARWASQNGMPIWPEERLTVDALTRQYLPDEFYLGWYGDEAVATMVLQRQDPLFWPDAPEGEALYLHKLAVSRAHAGQGLAQAMLRAAVEETRAAGRPFLRLDTAAEQPRLRAIYQDFGFQERGERDLSGFRAVLYELRV